MKNEIKGFTVEKILNSRIMDETAVPEIEPIVMVKGANFAVRGDISFISGLPKTGKSTISEIILATALMPEMIDSYDNLGIRATFCKGKPVIYIDTEQPKIYAKKKLESIKKILNVAKKPENLEIFSWRHHTYQENRQAIEVLFEHFSDAHLWVIDGITDFVRSANDEESGNETIRFFMGKASELNTTIILLIHENPANGKLRGHLGSEAERKCGGAITIKKDREKQIHWIEPKLIRGSADFEKIYFRYDETKGRMVSLDDNSAKLFEKEQSSDFQKIAELENLVRTIMGNQKEMTRVDFRKHIEQIQDPDNSQNNLTREQKANRKIQEFLGVGGIIEITGQRKQQTVISLLENRVFQTYRHAQI